MSNTIADVYTDCADDPAPHGRDAQVYEALHAMISPRNEVLRFLPHKERRMVGAWCFVDLFGPTDVQDRTGMAVAPHPHMGLQTVSWLVRGTVLHRDSIGTTALVEPGRVAIMNAGKGIAHSENSPADHGPVLHGVQLWVALPETARHGDHAFVLHEEAPIRDSPGLRAKVFVGRVGATVAPAQGVTPLVGADLSPESPQSRAGSVPLDPSYEHLLLPMVGAVRVCGEDVPAGRAIYLGTDRDRLDLELSEDARVLLLGGTPFGEEIVMWWNFVARSHEEIEQARLQWNAGGDPRFGEVSHYPGPERMRAPDLPNVRLRARGRRR
ncbi:MAG TPA: pirin family protein [Dermatophilaceae bacterium]|jgi:redox-sensitive bicupin YhaK (pirin superfamily)